MERDFRFRVSGVIFFIIFLLQLILTKRGGEFISDLFNKPDTFQIVIAIMSGFSLIFASDSIGFVFSSIFNFCFNLFGGYAGLYRQKIVNLDDYIKSIYYQMDCPISESPFNTGFELRFKDNKKYNTEHFLVYFLWHRPKGVNDNLHKWIERRYTAYFTSYTFIVAAVIALSFSFLLICKLNLVFTYENISVWVITGIISFFVWNNGERAKQDAISIIDLYISGFTNPKIKEMVKTYFSSSCFEFEKNNN